MSDLIQKPAAAIDAFDVIELDERLDMSLDALILASDITGNAYCPNKQYCGNCVSGCACS